MYLEFLVKPINDKKDTYWTSPFLYIFGSQSHVTPAL